MAKSPSQASEQATSPNLQNTLEPGPGSKPEGVGTSLAPIVGASAVTVGGKRYEIVRRVNTTTLTLDVDSDGAYKANRSQMTIVARILSPIREGRALQHAKYPTPAKLMLLEAEDGTQGELVVSHILMNELQREYPGDEPSNSYVGKWFLITKFRKAPDKRYNKFEIMEIAAPTGEVQSAA